jgi:cytochrome c
MKKAINLLIVLFISLLISCGDKDAKKKDGFSYGKKPTTETKTSTQTETILPSESIDLTNKGIGPITSLELPAEIDKEMVAHGKEIYAKLCTACHRPDRKFIGPAQNGIMTRRTPEWVMNMILNPEEMIQKDPLAKALLIEFNSAPMANQNLSQEDARAVLEYFRTLK